MLTVRKASVIQVLQAVWKAVHWTRLPILALHRNTVLLILCETWQTLMTRVNNLWLIFLVDCALHAQYLYLIDNLSRKHGISKSWWTLVAVLFLVLIIHTMNSKNMRNWFYVPIASQVQFARYTKIKYFADVVILCEVHNMDGEVCEAESFANFTFIFFIQTRAVHLFRIFCTVAEVEIVTAYCQMKARLEYLLSCRPSIIAPHLDNITPLNGLLRAI